MARNTEKGGTLPLARCNGVAFNASMQERDRWSTSCLRSVWYRLARVYSETLSQKPNKTKAHTAENKNLKIKEKQV